MSFNFRFIRGRIARHGWNHGHGGADEIPGLFETVDLSGGTRDPETPQAGDILVGSATPPGMGLITSPAFGIIGTLPTSLVNARRLVAGPGIELIDNGAGLTLVIQAQVGSMPMPLDGDPGEEGLPGPPGRDGISGADGADGTGPAEFINLFNYAFTRIGFLEQVLKVNYGPNDILVPGEVALLAESVI